jgi:hypothetical protein
MTSQRFKMPRLLGLAAVVLALAACGEQDEPGDPLSPTGPTGRIRFVNAVTNAIAAQRPVNVRVGELPLIANLGYGAAVPGTATVPYYAALAQQHAVDVRRTADTTATVFSGNFTVPEGEDITLVLVRNAAGATAAPELQSISDADNTAPSAGVRLRFLHMAPSAGGTLDVYVTPNTTVDLTNLTPRFAGVSPRTATAYLDQAAGNYTVRFTLGGTKTVLLTVNLGALPNGAVRSVFALDAAAGGTPLTSLVLIDR